MEPKPIEINDAGNEVDQHYLLTGVVFDPVDVADALDKPVGVLLAAMLRTVAEALAVDAVQLGIEDMGAAGRLMGRDGFPDGWPVAQLAMAARARLFPREGAQ